MPKARAIAFYLPQYHPVAENDQWWGKGFTEWINVAKARPLFPGHYQPHLPADFGFYDLRIPEARRAQASMAKEHGIEGFCYWHYWFSGKRLLERPFKEVLKSGEPDFPFCLAWANHDWVGKEHGLPQRILFKQDYPGAEDYKDHFASLREAFRDKRYITVDGKPLFLIYRPQEMPDCKAFCEVWRDEAREHGFKGLYLIGIAKHSWLKSPDHGFDALMIPVPESVFPRLFPKEDILDRILYRLTGKKKQQIYRSLFKRPRVYSYKQFVKEAFNDPGFENSKQPYFPCVTPNWDTTPRSDYRGGLVLHESTPELFRVHFKEALEKIVGRPQEQRLLFLKSWNEWAEGNHLEPDQRFGKKYLESISSCIGDFY